MEDLSLKAYPDVKQSFGVLGMYFLFTLLATLIIIPVNGLIDKELQFFLIYLLINGATLAWAFFYRARKSGSRSFSFETKDYRLIVPVVIATIALLIGVVSPILSVIPMSDFLKKVLQEMGEMKGMFGFLTVVIAAPIFEELIFRGIILDGLLKKYGATKAILLSSLLFGIAHLNIPQFVVAFSVGVLMGWVYVNTKNLWFTILIHFTCNLTSFFSDYSGEDPTSGGSIADYYGGVDRFLFVTLLALTVLGVSLYHLRHLFRDKQ